MRICYNTETKKSFCGYLKIEGNNYACGLNQFVEEDLDAKVIKSWNCKQSNGDSTRIIKTDKDLNND